MIIGYKKTTPLITDLQPANSAFNAKFDRFFRSETEDVHLAAKADGDFWTDMIIAPNKDRDPNYSAVAVEFLQKQSAKTAAILSDQLNRLSGYLATLGRGNECLVEDLSSSPDYFGMMAFPLATLRISEPTSMFGQSDASPYDGVHTRFVNLYWFVYFLLLIVNQRNQYEKTNIWTEEKTEKKYKYWMLINTCWYETYLAYQKVDGKSL